MNPMQIIQMAMNGGNPQDLVIGMLESQLADNPLGQTLLALARSNDNSGIERVVRNFVQSQGKDFDQEFASFKQFYGL